MYEPKKYTKKEVLEAILERCQKSIEILKKHGYKPLAVTTLLCEETFCFATEKEAAKAHMQFEVKPRNKKEMIQGWWYGKKYFLHTINKDYPKKFGHKPIVLWL